MQIQKNADDSKRVMYTETSSPGLNTGIQIGVVIRSSLNTNASINTQVQSLSTQQRKVFDVVCEWARKKVIHMNSTESHTPKPLHLFITGGAGIGKSLFINLKCF